MEGEQNFLQQLKKEKNQNTWKNVGNGPKNLLNLFLHVWPAILWSILVLIILGALIIGGAFYYFATPVKQITQNADQALQHLDQGQNLFVEQRFSLAQTEFSAANENFFLISQTIGQIRSLGFTRFTLINEQLQIMDDLLIVANNLTEMLVEISGFGEELLNVLHTDSIVLADISGENRKMLLEKLVELGDYLQKNENKIIEVEQAYARLQPHKNSKYFGSIIQPLSQYLPAVIGGVKQFAQASKILPEVAGLDQEKTYLFLLQNNHELRPSGGFLGQYGIVKIKNGDLISFVTDNIYNIDVKALDLPSRQPPAPITKYMAQPNWYMRDSNWWPDFPTSAKNVEDFYHWQGGMENNIHGVIAINPDVIASLLDFFGPITIEDLTFDQNNFVDELEYQVELGYLKAGIDLTQRKEIIGKLAKELEARLYATPVSRWPEFLNVLEQNLNNKSILLYSKNSDVQNYIENKYWAGRVIETLGDYLQVVDANLAALKTDRLVKREISYVVKPRVNGLQAELTVKYTNDGYFDWRTTRYRSYTRIYVPLGSQLKKLELNNREIDFKEIDFSQESGKTVFGYFFEVEPKQSKTLKYVYDLPDSVYQSLNNGNYQLLIQKQSGVSELLVNLNLNLGRKISAVGSEKKIDQIQFSEKITKDQLYTLTIE